MEIARRLKNACENRSMRSVLCIPFRTTVDGRTKCAWPDCVSEAARLYCEYIQRPWRDCQLPEIEPAQTHGKKTADELDGLTDKH